MLMGRPVGGMPVPSITDGQDGKCSDDDLELELIFCLMPFAIFISLSCSYCFSFDFTLLLYCSEYVNFKYLLSLEVFK